MLLKRVIRVDHFEQYKVPKYKENADEKSKRLWEKGCAPKPIRRAEIDICFNMVFFAVIFRLSYWHEYQPKKSKNTEIDTDSAIVSLKVA
ncbi:unnamed protein product [Angiostrongylus costaricensis]|uniref:Uncharacterized protein n=1 Tax=Angiostrongylus costaricensis TaxID=334426 RepID=A0A0R3PWM2_ANGCS|nr:unnamed protein product [Angiostrongylus costaricensis]